MATKKKKKVAKKKKPAIKKKVVKRKPAIKKKAVKRKPARKVKKVTRPKKAVVAAKPKKEEGTVIGVVTHYFPHVQAAVTKLKAPLSVGDAIKVKGHTTDFTQTVNSIQINHVPVNSAKKKDEIGFQVISRVRQHDVIYKI